VITLRRTATGVLLDVRVIPRASRTVVGGVREGRLLVRVTAAPVDGAATDAVIRALADALDVPRQALHITTGLTSKNKTLAISGGDEHAIRAHLTRLSGGWRLSGR
jgi:hypothetical protein